MSTAIENLKEAKHAHDEAIIAARKEERAQIRAATPIVRPASEPDVVPLAPPSERETELVAQIAEVEALLATSSPASMNPPTPPSWISGIEYDLLERRRARLKEERVELEAVRRAQQLVAVRGARQAAKPKEVEIMTTRTVPQPGDRIVLLLGGATFGQPMIDGKPVRYNFPLSFVPASEIEAHEKAIAEDEARLVALHQWSDPMQVRNLVVVPEGANLNAIMRLARESGSRRVEMPVLTLSRGDREWLAACSREAIAFLTEPQPKSGEE